MREVCESNMCTACGACENICNKEAIIRTKRWDGSWYMSIDENRCVNCSLCRKVCPSINESLLNEPMAAFAGWSTDSNMHRNSASGGIASELYMYAIRKGWYFVGVQLDRNFEAHYQIGNAKCDIEKFRNSKYTFSYMDDIFKKIEAIIRDNIKVIFVGLPCQVAAIKKYCALKKLNIENLVTVDIVCHGTPSPEFLKQHICEVENKRGEKAEFCYFRDPRYNTDKFIFSLYNNKGRKFYKKKVKSDDYYQIGYHSALIYRDPCYRCVYAQRRREGDITISDYHGLGSKTEYKGSRNAVSCILTNTEKGKFIIRELKEEQRLQLFERPLLEPLEGEPQFNHPSIAPKEREIFKTEYIGNQNYNAAADKAFEKIKVQSMKEGIVDFRAMRIKVSLWVSPEKKRKLKKILKLIQH